ncbi:site-specific integrase, partial [Ruficoccus amylovorans]
TTHLDRALKHEKELKQGIALQEQGLPVPSHLFGAPTRKILDLVADYERSHTAKRLRQKHIHDTVTRIKTLAEVCNWEDLGDITPTGFEQWRGQVPVCERTGRELSAKTINEYLLSMRAFLNWLKKQGIIERDPLEYVEKCETRGNETKNRREWTDDELETFMRYGKPPHRADYRIGIWLLHWTGLRKNELQNPRWGDVFIDDGKAQAIIRAKYSKGRTSEQIPLMPKVVAQLHSMRPKKWKPEDKVLPFRLPGSEQFRVDQERAGLVYKNEFGDHDFHSLRYSHGHWLAVRGVPLLVIQAILRHKDPSTTARHYMNIAKLAANKTLEEVYASEGCTPNCTPLDGQEGLLRSQTVTKSGKLEVLQIAVGDALSRALAPFVTQGLNPVNGCPSLTLLGKLKIFSERIFAAKSC